MGKSEVIWQDVKLFAQQNFVTLVILAGVVGAAFLIFVVVLVCSVRKRQKRYQRYKPEALRAAQERMREEKAQQFQSMREGREKMEAFLRDGSSEALPSSQHPLIHEKANTLGRNQRHKYSSSTTSLPSAGTASSRIQASTSAQSPSNFATDHIDTPVSTACETETPTNSHIRMCEILDSSMSTSPKNQSPGKPRRTLNGSRHSLHISVVDPSTDFTASAATESTATCSRADPNMDALESIIKRRTEALQDSSTRRDVDEDGNRMSMISWFDDAYGTLYKKHLGNYSRSSRINELGASFCEN